MLDFLLQYEASLRLAGFAGLLLGMLVWEQLAPCRHWPASTGARRVTNLALTVLNTLLVRLLFPLAAVGAALVAQQQGWGLLHLWPVPPLMALILAFVLLDFAIWLQHVAMHHWPWLWRLHRVHHSDTAFDVTTGVRFHPLEAILSMAYKMLVVLALGAPAAAVILFELALSMASLFNHGNVRLPAAAEGLLRWFIVTPDFHRVHHSTRVEETNSNYGFFLTLWDRLFGTCRAQPALGHDAMQIGLREYLGQADIQKIRRLLELPAKP